MSQAETRTAREGDPCSGQRLQAVAHPSLDLVRPFPHTPRPTPAAALAPQDWLRQGRRPGPQGPPSSSAASHLPCAPLSVTGAGSCVHA